MPKSYLKVILANTSTASPLTVVDVNLHLFTESVLDWIKSGSPDTDLIEATSPVFDMTASTVTLPATRAAIAFDG